MIFAMCSIVSSLQKHRSGSSQRRPRRRSIITASFVRIASPTFGQRVGPSRRKEGSGRRPESARPQAARTGPSERNRKGDARRRMCERPPEYPVVR